MNKLRRTNDNRFNKNDFGVISPSLQYMTSPNENVDYTNWATGQPNNVGGGEMVCVECLLPMENNPDHARNVAPAMVGGTWSIQDCSQAKGSVCERAVTSTATTTTTTPSSNPDFIGVLTYIPI